MNINNLIAGGTVPLGTINGLGTELSGSTDPYTAVGGIISAAIGIMTVIAAVYFLFNIITGAMAIISSAGDKGALETGRNKITYGFIGLAVAIAAIFIMGVVATILNIPTILDLSQIGLF